MTNDLFEDREDGVDDDSDDLCLLITSGPTPTEPTRLRLVIVFGTASASGKLQACHVIQNEGTKSIQKGKTSLGLVLHVHIYQTLPLSASSQCR